MDTDHTISGLLRKRAEIAGKLDVALNVVRDLQTDLAHVDATLRLFRPDINLSGVKVRPVPGHAAALYGELTRAIMEALRGCTEFTSGRDLTLAIMRTRGLAVDDGKLVETMRQRVGAALRTMKARGTAESDRGHGLELVWRLMEK